MNQNNIVLGISIVVLAAIVAFWVLKRMKLRRARGARVLQSFNIPTAFRERHSPARCAASFS